MNMTDNNFWRIENGKAVPMNCGTKTLPDTNAYTPHGAYTTFRTYERFGILRLTKHFDRLEETSALAGMEFHPDRDALKAILAELISDSVPGEKRIRITVDLEKQPGTVYIAMEPLKTPTPEQYRDGIVCLTTTAHRENPKAKLSSFLGKAETIRSGKAGDFYEILMCTPEGDLLEGLSSNFYGVMDGSVITAEEGVLSGTTRGLILKLVHEAGIPVALRPVKLSELESLDEAFISSTSRSILPIRSIDGIEMKAKVPGPVTAALSERFAAGLRDEIEWLS